CFLIEFHEAKITIGPIKVVNINKSRLSPSRPTRYFTSKPESMGLLTVRYCTALEFAASKLNSKGSDSRKVAPVAIKLIHLIAFSLLTNKMAAMPMIGKKIQRFKSNSIFKSDLQDQQT